MIRFTLNGSIVEEKKIPTAAMTITPQFGVLGSVVVLDARPSTDPNNNDLSYEFSFLRTPIGSKVGLEGFKKIEESGSVVSFSPDTVGQYTIGLRVSNGVVKSDVEQISCDIRHIMVPHARGLVPDGKFIWSYLRDVWTQVEGRELFETLWSALVQICGAEMLKLYQVDFNKSIRDIQDLYQRRWLSYEPRLKIDDENATFFLGHHQVGHGATTGATGDGGAAIVTSRNELMVVQGTVRPDLAGRKFKLLYSKSDENVGEYEIAGMTARRRGLRLTRGIPKNPTNTRAGEGDFLVDQAKLTFTFQSKVWSLVAARRWDMVASELMGFPVYKTDVPPALAQVRRGDVIRVMSGVNAGLYRIVEKSGSSFIVDRAPPAASEDVFCEIHRPVGFVIPPEESALSDTITIPLSEAPELPNIAPGRMIVVGGQAHTITRVAVDRDQRVPIVSIAVDRKTVMPGMKSLYWRVPHTLVSKTQDFEELGVCAGDLFTASVVTGDGISVDVPLQVVGVDRKRIGFVLSNESVVEGEIPTVPNRVLQEVAARFSIPQIVAMPNGTLSFQETAATSLSELNSVFFKREYTNKELSTESVFTVAGRTYQLVPKSVTRNRLIPVHEDVRSIPALQEFVRQPEVFVRGDKIYQSVGEKTIELQRMPAVLHERSHYLIDSIDALRTDLTFRTGTSIIDAEGGDFVDRGIMPGDSFIIESPLTIAGEYPVARVLSRNKLALSKPVPKYPLGELTPCSVRIKRSRTGHYLRIIPGLFTAKNPAPDRLWGEVTFFDNGENIERNFGIRVGLTRDDLESATNTASYRQAVAGLMFAFVSGPAVDKIRLGVSLLLGLPFTERRGIIRAIDTDYRLNAKGEAKLGRIVVEDIDEDDSPLGISRIYTFPVDETSSLAGIDINPATKEQYAVGDIVEAYASLSKGVEIEDFSKPTNRGNPIRLLQQFHSARIKINDSIFDPKEFGLISSFLRKITPSYVSLVIANMSEFRDQVQTKDKARFRSRQSRWSAPVIADNISFGLPGGLFLDARTHQSVYWNRFDEGPVTIRKAGKELRTEGDRARLDLGGFVEPPQHALMEAPVVRPGDELLFLSGPNTGRVRILAVSDGELTLDREVALASKQGYAVLRRVTALLRAGAVEGSVGNLVAVEDGLRNDCVMPGDLFIALDGSKATRHLVVSVSGPNGARPPWNQLRVTPALPELLPEDGVTYRIYRPAFFTSPSEEAFEVSSTGTSAIACSDPLLAALAEPGDELELQREDRMCVQVLDSMNLRVTPPLPTGTYTVRIRRRGRAATPVTFDQMRWNLKDVAELSLGVGLKAPASAGAPKPTFAGSLVTWPSGFNPARAGARPGDFFRVLAGSDSTRDVGYGAGTYPVAEVSSTTVTLTVPLVDGGTEAWAISRRA